MSTNFLATSSLMSLCTGRGLDVLQGSVITVFYMTFQYSTQCSLCTHIRRQLFDYVFNIASIDMFFFLCHIYKPLY